jgi:hypothetical protein
MAMNTEQQDARSEAETQEPDTGQAQPAAPEGSTAQGGQEVLDELGRLGNKLVEVIDTAWNSEQRKRIEEDLRVGLKDVGSSLEDGLRQLSEDEQAKDLMGRAEDVAENISHQVRSSEITRELTAGLAKGLHILGDQLDHLVQEMKASGTADAEKETATRESDDSELQDIPIQDEESEG